MKEWERLWGRKELAPGTHRWRGRGRVSGDLKEGTLWTFLCLNKRVSGMVPGPRSAARAGEGRWAGCGLLQSGFREQHEPSARGIRSL